MTTFWDLFFIRCPNRFLDTQATIQFKDHVFFIMEQFCTIWYDPVWLRYEWHCLHSIRYFINNQGRPGNPVHFSYNHVYLYLNLLIPQCIKKQTCCIWGTTTLLSGSPRAGSLWDLSALDLSERGFRDCLCPLLPTNNQCMKSHLWLTIRQMLTTDDKLKRWKD